MQFVDKARIDYKGRATAETAAPASTGKSSLPAAGRTEATAGRGGKQLRFSGRTATWIRCWTSSLRAFTARENGEKGRAARSSGKNGQDLIIKVPVGTLCKGR